MSQREPADIDYERARVAKLESDNHYLRELIRQRGIRMEPYEVVMANAKSKPVHGLSKDS